MNGDFIVFVFSNIVWLAVVVYGCILLVDQNVQRMKAESELRELKRNIQKNTKERPVRKKKGVPNNDQEN